MFKLHIDEPPYYASPGHNGIYHGFLLIGVAGQAKKTFFFAVPSLGCANFGAMKALRTSQLVLSRSSGTICWWTNIGPLGRRRKHTVHCKN